LSDRLFLACGLAWAAGVIHVEAAIDHVDEHISYSVFFVLLAAAQFLWGFAIGRSPTRRMLLVGAIASLMIVALWIVSRTSGLPVGPESWSPEPVGVLDSLASADEALLALILALQLGRGRVGVLFRAGRHLVTTTGVCLVLLSSLTLAYAGHAH
jgi:hypothetical protein